MAGRQQFVQFSPALDLLSQAITSVGLGSDYDGVGSVPVGLEDVSTYPALVKVTNSF